MAWEEKMRTTERDGKRKLKQKLQPSASWDNGIKTDIAIVVAAVCFWAKTKVIKWKNLSRRPSKR